MDNQVWYIILSIIILLLFGIIRWIFKDQLSRAISCFRSAYQSHRDFKGGTIVYSQFNILASCLYFLSLGFIIFKVNYFYHLITLWGDFTTFCIAVVALIIFTYLKILIYLMTGFLVDNYQITREFVFNWITINHIAGIIFLPIAIGLAFVDTRLLLFFIWGGIFLWTFFYFYRIVRGLKIIFIKKTSPFYILLYLCTLEFLPIVALWHFLGK